MNIWVPFRAGINQLDERNFPSTPLCYIAFTNWSFTRHPPYRVAHVRELYRKRVFIYHTSCARKLLLIVVCVHVWVPLLTIFRSSSRSWLPGISIHKTFQLRLPPLSLSWDNWFAYWDVQPTSSRSWDFHLRNQRAGFMTCKPGVTLWTTETGTSRLLTTCFTPTLTYGWVCYPTHEANMVKYVVCNEVKKVFSVKAQILSLVCATDVRYMTRLFRYHIGYLIGRLIVNCVKVFFF